LILIVDDCKGIGTGLRAILKAEGLSAEWVAGGKDALAWLSSRIPRLVILDQCMPEMDGFTFLRHLRGTETLKNIPVIMNTATTTSEGRSEAEGLAVIAYLQKGDDEWCNIAKLVMEHAG
jgi:DNA-binding response OmpR family regulator